MKIQQEITLIPSNLKLDYFSTCSLLDQTLKEYSAQVFISNKKPQWLDVDWYDYKWAVSAVQRRVKKEIRDCYDEGYNHIVIKIIFDKKTQDLSFDIHRVTRSRDQIK